VSVTTCLWSRRPCPRPVWSRGYCRYHHDCAAYLGLIQVGWADANPVRELIAQHLDRGRSCVTLAALTGMHHDSLYDIHAGRRRSVRVSTVAAVAAVPLPPSSVGCVRRVQALRRLGWTLKHVAAQTVLPLRTLTDALAKPVFTPPVAERVVAGYGRLSNTRGPSRRAALRAAAEGCAPPMAWEGIDIDDPAAVPLGDRTVVIPRPRLTICVACKANQVPAGRTKTCSESCGLAHRKAANAARQAGYRRRTSVTAGTPGTGVAA
jgi:hypothetical protein